MRWKSHVRFGGRAGETDPPRGGHRAPVRSHWVAAGLVAVRHRIQRRKPRGHVTPAFDPEVFRSRFLALRRADCLGEEEVARLEALFAAHADLGRAWAMLQELHGLYLAEDDAAAMDCLDRFSRLYAEDPLPDRRAAVNTECSDLRSSCVVHSVLLVADWLLISPGRSESRNEHSLVRGEPENRCRRHIREMT